VQSGIDFRARHGLSLKFQRPESKSDRIEKFERAIFRPLDN
jgi:hypothetical protein